MSRIALATSIAHVGVAIGHTAFGLDIFSRAQWSTLPRLLFAYARVGWYQGSILFTIAGLHTYQMSQRDPSTWTTVERAIAGILIALYWASSAWYFKHGDKPTGLLTAVVGAMQALTLAQ
ncbi:uncharacterized protein PV06_05653 [Exophiala oligosperma]|uniref:Uncharacterized protein n=1 Tax=Exophiala oligosperma TaxID=215243 RepID=A0A0D2E2T0_9EURO|nr:uncharacterized protein PV06_05653 [Exophiala oligosperma]KIW42069.1 hypothetical protein PV06_05653 [Exophiala oligosperma]